MGLGPCAELDGTWTGSTLPPQHGSFHVLTSPLTNTGAEYSRTRHVMPTVNPGQEKPLEASGAWG